MNPNENNPVSPAGANGVSGGMTPTSPVPSPVDFTNPSSLNTNTSSLSASDSLASAQDNLMSAGQAADTGASGAVGLDQLDMDASSAKMDRPNEALKPADPVPGSIGSVTSVPPLASAPMDMSAFDSAASTTTSAAPAASSAMPVMGGGASTTSAGATSAFGGTTGAMGATGSAGAGATTAKPVQPYYNPFARTMGGNAGNANATTTPTSSANVPPALQPQTEKFSDRLNGAGNGKKKSNIMTLLGWLLAALFAVTTVIFLVLWLGAKDNEKIIYRDPPAVPQTPVQDVVSLMTCTQDIPNPVIDGLGNVLNQRREASLGFVNDNLEKVDFANIYTFTDNAAAEAARGYFDGQNGWFGEIATNTGVTAITTNLNIEGNTARFDLAATKDNLVGDYTGVFALTVGEDGKLNTNIDAIRESYTNAGFACSTE